MDYINAFWVGGLVCALVQILMEKTKLMPGRIMVLLVCSGAFLHFLGLFQPIQDYLKHLNHIQKIQLICVYQDIVVFVHL